MKNLFVRLPRPVRTILSVVGGYLFVGYMIVIYSFGTVAGALDWRSRRERRARVAQWEREAEELQQQMIREEEFRRANPPQVDVPSDQMRVCLLQYPMTFLTEARFPDGLGGFMAENRVFPCTRFTRENERDFSAALARVGGEFVTTTDESGFDTGVEIWFESQEAADRFSEQWLK